jgi:hypothetical protein
MQDKLDNLIHLLEVNINKKFNTNVEIKGVQGYLESSGHAMVTVKHNGDTYKISQVGITVSGGTVSKDELLNNSYENLIGWLIEDGELRDSSEWPMKLELIGYGTLKRIIQE